MRKLNCSKKVGRWPDPVLNRSNCSLGEDMLETNRELSRQLQLNDLMLSNFVSPSLIQAVCRLQCWKWVNSLVVIDSATSRI
jgi:hypothetical protein